MAELLIGLAEQEEGAPSGTPATTLTPVNMIFRASTSPPGHPSPSEHVVGKGKEPAQYIKRAQPVGR